MQLRFAIPLTLLMLALFTKLSMVLELDFAWPMIVLTAAWAAWDSRKISADKYKSMMALPPIGVLVVVILLWPLTFPWYLKLRHRIRVGTVQVREYPPNLKPFIIGAVVVGALIGGSWLAVWMSPKADYSNMLKVPQAIHEKFGTPVHVNFRNGSMFIIFPNPTKSKAALIQQASYARQIAEVARASYIDGKSVSTVHVGIFESKNYGPFFHTSSTRELHTFTYHVDGNRSNTPNTAANDTTRWYAENCLQLLGREEIDSLLSLSNMETKEWGKPRDWLEAAATAYPRGEQAATVLMHFDKYSSGAANRIKLVYEVQTPTDTVVYDVLIYEEEGNRFLEHVGVAKNEDS